MPVASSRGGPSGTLALAVSSLILIATAVGCAAPWTRECLPGDTVIRPFLADPRRPHSGARLLRSLQAHGDRIETAVGGRQTLVRFTTPSTAASDPPASTPSQVPAREPSQAIDIGVYGAMFAQWDLDHKWDLIGLDGLFGFPIVYRRGWLAAEIDLWHWSAHIGDELIERTGRKRINYRREEVALALSFDLPYGLRSYVEGGLGINLGPKNEPLRVQAGIDYEGSLLYAGIDVLSKEEVDWKPNVALQAGVVLRSANHTSSLRLGVECYRGRSTFGELFRERDEWLAAGCWIDF